MKPANAIWHDPMRFGVGGWDNWRSRGGATYYCPCGSSSETNRVDILTRGTNNYLYRMIMINNEVYRSWGSWGKPPGNLFEGPAALSWKD